VAGGLAGVALGYFAAKQRKKEMLDLLDHPRKISRPARG
jgi:hypothetical protein